MRNGGSPCKNMIATQYILTGRLSFKTKNNVSEVQIRDIVSMAPSIFCNLTPLVDRSKPGLHLVVHRRALASDISLARLEVIDRVRGMVVTNFYCY